VCTFNHHTDKVQCIAWHPSDSSVLATAAYDRTAKVFDVRTQGRGMSSWTLSAETESMAWNPHQQHQVRSFVTVKTMLCVDCDKIL
jgi:periodic tryptophan protein 1